jgi:hypothetical protein
VQSRTDAPSPAPYALWEANSVKFADVASRVSGISTPIFGISWTPPVSDVAVARRIVTFLEDRRVLYSPYEVEVPEHVVASVLSIRQYMTDVLAEGGIADELAAWLRSIRAAARKFLDQWAEIEQGEVVNVVPTDFGTSHMIDSGFNQALGEFRGVVGVAIAAIAAAFGLDVEEPLATILPSPDLDA